MQPKIIRPVEEREKEYKISFHNVDAEDIAFGISILLIIGIIYLKIKKTYK